MRRPRPWRGIIDDEFLEFLGLVERPTGRNDTEGRDFCDDIHDFPPPVPSLGAHAAPYL